MPGGQSRHAVLSLLEYWPAKHASQELIPSSGCTLRVHVVLEEGVHEQDVERTRIFKTITRYKYNRIKGPMLYLKQVLIYSVIQYYQFLFELHTLESKLLALNNTVDQVRTFFHDIEHPKENVSATDDTNNRQTWWETQLKKLWGVDVEGADVDDLLRTLKILLKESWTEVENLFVRIKCPVHSNWGKISDQENDFIQYWKGQTSNIKYLIFAGMKQDFLQMIETNRMQDTTQQMIERVSVYLQTSLITSVLMRMKNKEEEEGTDDEYDAESLQRNEILQDLKHMKNTTHDDTEAEKEGQYGLQSIAWSTASSSWSGSRVIKLLH